MSLPDSFMSEPPKKLPKPTPNVVIARPVTFWFARSVIVRKQKISPMMSEPMSEQITGINIARKAFISDGSASDCS